MRWDLGHYEQIAAQLQPAAEVVVDHLAPGADEVVLDLGCGTGNAALIAASRGARVVGVDPSPRLLGVARAAAAAAWLDATFTLGDAADLPVPEGSIDAIVSVFGVIFAPDATDAAAEMARVLRPGGRIVLSAWLRHGALADQARLRRELVAGVRPESRGNELFAWHDPDALAGLLAPYGFAVSVHDQALAFTAASPEASPSPSSLITRSGSRPATCWSRQGGGSAYAPTSRTFSLTPTKIQVPSVSQAATSSRGQPDRPVAKRRPAGTSRGFAPTGGRMVSRGARR